MRTAYSTQPRIPQPERNLPQYASFEDALEAMKADAAETMKRVEADMTQLNKNAPLADRNIHAYLEHNPGASTTDVATHFGRDVNSVSSMMSRMEERGMVTVAKRRLPHGGLGRFFTAVPGAAKPKTPTPEQKPKKQRKTDMVRDYVMANPGQTSHEIGAALGMTSRDVSATVSNLRRFHSLKITTRRDGTDRRLPGRYWIKEAAQ